MLRGKRILVTGASSGIGREIAVRASQSGASVVLVARDEARLKETLLCLEGGNHEIIIFDFAATEKIATDLEPALASLAGFDGMVYAAGKDALRPLKISKPNVMFDVLSVNFFSFYELTRIFCQKKISNPGSSVLGISSVVGQRARKGYSSYAASKAAMDSAVKSLAFEMADGRRINSIAPGIIDTKMTQKGLETASCDWVGQRQHLGMGKPSDVAAMAVFLLSDGARFVTGSVIPVDGGYLAY